MRTVPRLILMCLLGSAGCSVQNPAFALDGGGDSAGPGTTTSAPTSSSGPDGTTGSGSAGPGSTGGTTGSGSATGSDATTTVPDSTTAMVDSTGTSSGSTGAESVGGSTTGGVNECMAAVPEEPPRLEVKKSGQVLKACGGSKSLTDAYATFSGSTLQVYDSGTCTPTGTLYEITGVNFAITPLEFGESCSDVRIEWAAVDPCEVTGFALTNGDKPAYVGAFGRTTGPDGYAAFAVEPVQECGCVVDGVACCQHLFELDQTLYMPGEYTLDFPGAAAPIGAQESIDGEVDGASYLFRNLRSMVHAGCMAAPSHIWLDLRWWAMRSN